MNVYGAGNPSLPSGPVVIAGLAPLVSSGPTVAIASGSKLSNTSATATVKVTISWVVVPGGVAVCTNTLQKSTNNGTSWSNVALGSATMTTGTTTMAASKATRFRIRATGCDGAASAWATGNQLTARILQENNTALSFSAGWQSIACSACSGGSQEITSTPGSAATVGLTAVESAAIVLSTGVTDGQSTVAVDGGVAVTVNSHTTAASHLKLALVQSWATVGNHILVLTNLATAGSPNSQFDALITLG